MRQIDSPTSLAHERQRLERICAVLVEAFEAHPKTRDADRCAIKLDNQRVNVIDDYDDPGELWSASRLAAHYAVGVHFIYTRADEPGVIRLGAGPSSRSRFDPAVVRERWAGVNAPPPEARTRRRRPTTKLRVVPTDEPLEFDRRPLTLRDLRELGRGALDAESRRRCQSRRAPQLATSATLANGRSTSRAAGMRGSLCPEAVTRRRRFARSVAAPWQWREQRTAGLTRRQPECPARSDGAPASYALAAAVVAVLVASQH